MTSSEKWILYNQVEWKRLLGQEVEVPPAQTQSSSKKVVMCMVGLESSSLIRAPLKNQVINCNKYCYQLDQLKAAPNKKCMDLFNRKCIIFYQDNAMRMFI